MAHDLDAPPVAAARVILSPVSELIFASNFALSHDQAFAGFDPEWRAEQRRQLPESARPYMEFAEEGLDWATLSLCDYVTASDIHDDWEELAAFVLGKPIEDFVSVVLNGDIPGEEMERLFSQPDKAADWADRLSCFSRMKPERAVAVFADPKGFRERLLAFVEANRTEAFAAKMAELLPRFKSRMESIGERLKGKDPIAFAEELSRKPCPYPREFRSYSFVPSYFVGKKHLYSYGGGNFEYVFNIAELPESDREESKVLSELLRVLGDRTRLDILRMLSEGPSYGKELAGRLGLTTATVSRQLDQLKSAGLVLEERADTNNVKLVRLERSAVDKLFGQLQNFLGTD